MIERLEGTAMTDNYGNTYGYHNITEHEMVAKINEIIDWVNKFAGSGYLPDQIKHL